MAEGIVYAMCSTKHDKIYIGCTHQFSKRTRQHVAHILDGTHPCQPVLEHFAGHAPSDIYFRILERVPDGDNVFAAERRWIRQLRPLNVDSMWKPARSAQFATEAKPLHAIILEAMTSQGISSTALANLIHEPVCKITRFTLRGEKCRSDLLQAMCDALGLELRPAKK